MKIGTARAWGRLRDFFDLKGKHELLLDEVVVPVAVVADLTEADPLADVRQALGGDTRAGVAGQNTQVQLFNPAGSGVMFELYLISVGQQAVTATLNLGPTTAALGADRGAQWQDGRLPGNPVGRIQFANVVGILLIDAFKVRTLPSTNAQFNVNAFVPPGRGFMIEAVTAATPIEAGFLWRERDLLPGE
ncbi:MAG: hypothetical protein V3S55_01620 [Nitrospiraceae bacterium]